MPKDLASPLVVVAEQVADRVEILTYTVDAAAKVVADVTLQPSRLNADQATRTILPNVSKAFDVDVTAAAVADATLAIVFGALAAASVSDDVTAQVRAAFDADPDLAWELYYAGTRDAIYARVG